jgi:putative Mn2+ efflux pump MntP
MQLTEIILIAVALAMDAFAVSVASGITIKRLHLHHAVRIAASFGFFQAIMPVLGWFSGVKARDIIGGVDHWIAFGLLLFIGGKMIYEAFQLEEAESKTNPLEAKVLLVLSIATSIDAFAAGMSFAMLEMEIIGPVLLIGLVTFLLSLLGVWIGDRFGHFFEKKFEIAGGVMLIAIGIKILLYG